MLQKFSCFLFCKNFDVTNQNGTFLEHFYTSILLFAFEVLKFHAGIKAHIPELNFAYLEAAHMPEAEIQAP